MERRCRWLGGLAGLAVIGAGATAALATSPLTLKERLMAHSDFQVYNRSRVVVVPTPAGWARANPWTTAHTLHQTGFVTAAYADLDAVSASRRHQTSVLSIAV